VAPAEAGFVPAAVGLMLWPELQPYVLIAGFATAFGAMALAARSIRASVGEA